MANCRKILMWSINLITAWMLVAFCIVEIKISRSFVFSPVLGIFANICLALSPFTDTFMVINWTVIYGLSATASGILLALNMEPFSIISPRMGSIVGLIGQNPNLSAVIIMNIVIAIISLMAAVDLYMDISSGRQTKEPILPLHHSPVSHGDQKSKKKFDKGPKSLA
jgi:hypothetical protein